MGEPVEYSFKRGGKSSGEISCPRKREREQISTEIGRNGNNVMDLLRSLRRGQKPGKRGARKKIQGP